MRIAHFFYWGKFNLLQIMNRLAELDTLRAVAVLLVIGFHYRIPGLGFGFLGVDVFFVLSGFLITALLVKEWQREATIHLPAFYLRRLLRLLPALLLLLLVISPFEPAPHRLAALFYVANWATIFNWLPDLVRGNLNHIWSLSVEEQFYLIWPAILFLVLRSRIPQKYLFVLPLILAIASALERGILWLNNGLSFHLSRGTDTHSDGLFIGCTLAIVMAFGVKIPRYPALLTGIISFLYTILFCIGLVPEHTLYIGGYTLVALTISGILFAVIKFRSSFLGNLLSVPPMPWIGRISYGLYLWHFPTALFIQKFAFPHDLGIIVSIALTFVIATLSYYLIEQPALRLKNNLAVVHLAGA